MYNCPFLTRLLRKIFFINRKFDLRKCFYFAVLVFLITSMVAENINIRFMWLLKINMLELLIVSEFSLLILARLSSACPDLCVCDDGGDKLTCKNVKLTPEYLVTLDIPSTMREIYLTDNELSAISSDVLRPFRHATKLEISKNRIEDIPAYTFQEFENLTSLNLNNNKIRKINPHAFSGLTKLDNLELASNELTVLPAGIFDNISAVNSIKLMSNKIQLIPDGVFTDLRSLRLLFIRHNEISALGEKAFQNMSMNRIDLSYNKIPRLARSTFLNFNVKFKIMLYSNPLECNCGDVMTYAKEFKGLQNDVWGFCDSPANLKGKNILTAYTSTDCTMCDLNLCQNGGVCNGNQTSFSCLCLESFKGDVCRDSICQPEIRYINKVVQLPSTTVLKYIDKDHEKDDRNSSLLEKKNSELETKLMILYAICSLELLIILCFVGLLIMGKYQDWRLMKKYNKQQNPHILEKIRTHVDADNPPGKGYISISELIPYSY